MKNQIYYKKVKFNRIPKTTIKCNKALKLGVSFSIIDNISFWGEDRHFCIRAEALGLKLYVDTVYPAYHIYR